MRRNVRLKAALFSTFATAVLWAGTAHAQDICQTVASRLRTLKPPAEGGNLWRASLEVLAERSDPIVQLASRRRLSDGESKDVLEKEFHASPILLNEVGPIAQYPDLIELARFGQSDLHVVMATGGTAHCQAFVFFTASAAQSDLTVSPPILSENTSNQPIACSGFGSIGFAGAVAGVPAFFVERGLGSLLKSIVITPWRNGSWQQACTVVAQFSATFVVSKRYCKEPDCTRLGEQARTLISMYDRDPGALARGRAVEGKFGDRFSARSPLPTFGQDNDNPWLAYDSGSDVLRVTLDGTDYIARIGHGAIGWRVSTDYLVALYRMVGDDLNPVAGFEIAKRRGELVDVSVK